ncbi:hypothetical protein SODALDRAFT_40029 [Sodiomyces alkalinus F11]|uniref:Uncharacterized protein n=1 Tax=Sodiomyces alkalinus (strain CBS 110278 / VKM F-3762 / F11) TaxID=1314773 RepID=A0A3N2Q9Z9_SODAK|nr:hypothetical protein SODALDRAFT_40029 [Sodiomyces alkalinus F11]ROT43475.1 hypothetical protein SODALDRAFT_40029 [Sodiomyces alkalinus F11]
MPLRRGVSFALGLGGPIAQGKGRVCTHECLAQARCAEGNCRVRLCDLGRPASAKYAKRVPKNEVEFCCRLPLLSSRTRQQYISA